MDFIYKPTTAVAFVMNDVPEEEVGGTSNQPGMDALEWKEGLKPKSAALFLLHLNFALNPHHTTS